jgi:hypothetical protein
MRRELWLPLRFQMLKDIFRRRFLFLKVDDEPVAGGGGNAFQGADGRSPSRRSSRWVI